MLIRVLGSGAGGGFPQWNCDCPGCRAVRDGSRPCRSRTQSSIAVSADGHDWFLVNASPDIRAQIEAFPGLHPRDGRVTPIAAVLLTDAEIDHTLGLLLMREGRGIELHATAATLETLTTGSGVVTALERYTPVDRREVRIGDEVALRDGSGAESGLTYQAFDVPTAKAARFDPAGGPTGDEGRVIGYRFTDTRTGRAAVYVPGVQEFTPAVRDQFDDCACLLVDGTCWHDDELIRLGVGRKTAYDMGHLALGDPGGSLELLAGLPIEKKVYIHINNTNPILLEDSPERRTVAEHGFDVAVDGLEIEV